MRVAHATAGNVPIVVGVAPGLTDDPGATARELARAMRAHTARFGPFPYERLAVAVLPDIRGGIEYPGAILMGKNQIRDATASHEVAHEWFYGLIGDDQARDPWLDESFATYAEALDRGTGPTYERMTIPSGGKGRTGAPMTFWESRQSIYFRSVYIQGGVALLQARRASGAAAFDTAIRCHIRRNAHRITTPTDLRRSLGQLPAAIRVLTAAGALRPS
jgi:aminopeptidase N